VIRLILLLVVVGVVVGAIWWDRTERSKKRQIFFSLYNKALAKATDKKKLSGISINILDVMDETDIGPTYLHSLLKDMERSQHVIVKSNTVKLTASGVVYFKYKYLSEEVKHDSKV